MNKIFGMCIPAYLIKKEQLAQDFAFFLNTQ